MRYEEKREILKRFAIEQGLTPLEAIQLITSADAMSLDVDDLAKLPRFAGVLVYFAPGSGFWLLKDGSIFPGCIDPVTAEIVDSEGS